MIETLIDQKNCNAINQTFAVKTLSKTVYIYLTNTYIFFFINFFNTLIRRRFIDLNYLTYMNIFLILHYYYLLNKIYYSHITN